MVVKCVSDNFFKKVLFAGLFCLLLGHAQGQDVGDSTQQSVTVKEWNINIEINTAGAGLWYQHGWTPDYFNKHFIEVGFVYNRHPKAVRVKNTYYSGATSFNLIKKNCKDWKMVLVAILSAVLIWWFKVNPIWIIVVVSVGAVLYGVYGYNKMKGR